MYTKTDLKKDIASIGIKPGDTLLIHSSMKAVGDVENGTDTVLDAFIEYMKPGLLIFPTHTWKQISDEYPVYNPLTEPSCIGILTNLFLKRPGVVRSLHPTHSVAALGKDAASYINGEEQGTTPCSREGCWGKLIDRKAKVLFLGCSLKKNTFIHGVEEWNHIPMRLTEQPQSLKIITPNGQEIDRPMYRHQSLVGDISVNYDKLEAPFIYKGIAKKGLIGAAVSILCDAEAMADLTASFLQRKPDLFEDSLPIPDEWYKA